MLKRMNISNLTEKQRNSADKQAIEEHHAILFLIGVDKYKYGILIEDMKYDVLRKRYVSQNNRRAIPGTIQKMEAQQ